MPAVLLCRARSSTRSTSDPKRAAKTRTVEVNFSLPSDVRADRVALCGEFNNWSTDDIQLARDGNGSWRTSVQLEPGRSYRYRYLLDSQRWENGWAADDYLPNPYGGHDSVVEVPE